MIHYLKTSKSMQYSVILTAPFALLYEFSTLLLFSTQNYELRNTADILIRDWISNMGIDAPFIISSLFSLLFLLMIGLGIQKEEKHPIISQYFIYMILEGIAWGILLYLFLGGVGKALSLQILTNQVATIQLNLAIGAGVYEELIFRVLLIPVMLSIFTKGFQFNKSFSTVIAIIGSSVVFSLFHLFMEPFTLQSFMTRFLGGLFLSTLYVWRGYGIAVYAHISSNILTLYLL